VCSRLYLHYYTGLLCRRHFCEEREGAQDKKSGFLLVNHYVIKKWTVSRNGEDDMIGCRESTVVLHKKHYWR
jgi:hypothetical protein